MGFQVTLAARAVMQQAYACELKADDEMLPCTTRDVLLATQHPRLGACAPGRCPPDPQCLGNMEPVLPEAEAFLQLDFIARQVDVTRAARRLGTKCEGGGLSAAAPLLSPALEAASRLRSSCGYCWASIAQLLGAA
jgi:hypothetical protein